MTVRCWRRSSPSSPAGPRCWRRRAWRPPVPPPSWLPPRSRAATTRRASRVRAQGGGNPVIPLLADLRKQVSALDTAGVGARACGAHLADQPGRAGHGPDAARAQHRGGAAGRPESHDGGARRLGGKACGHAGRGQEPDPALPPVYVRAAGGAVVPRVAAAGAAAGERRVPGAVRRGCGNPRRRHRADRREPRHSLYACRFPGHAAGSGSRRPLPGTPTGLPSRPSATPWRPCWAPRARSPRTSCS